MGYKRRLPRTDDERKAALSTAKQNKDAVPPDKNPFSQKVSDALDVEEPKFAALRVALSVAEGNDHKSVANFSETLQKLKNLASHGLQLVNFKIIDETDGFTRAMRSFYNMDSSGHLPVMGTEAEIIQAANDFITGEELRIAEGGVALVDVSKASVEAMLQNVEQNRSARSASGKVLGKAQHNLTKERKIVDKLIRQMWEDIDYSARDMRTGAKHAYSKGWGMKFMHTPGYATLNVRVEDADSSLPLAGVSLRIGKPGQKSGAKATTNLHGTQIIRSKNFKPTSLIAYLPLYNIVAKDIQLEEGKTTTVVVKMKKTAQ